MNRLTVTRRLTCLTRRRAQWKPNRIMVSSRFGRKFGAYGGMVLTVTHDQPKVLGAADIRSFNERSSMVYGLQYLLPLGSCRS